MIDQEICEKHKQKEPCEECEAQGNYEAEEDARRGAYEAEMEARAKDEADRDYAYDQEQSYQGGGEGG